MTTLREAAKAALAFTMRDFASLRDFEAAKAVLHDNLRAALAQQDEPVAWLAPDGSIRKTPAAKSFREWAWGRNDFRPLYTAPPQRKPLTEEEIDRICALLGFALISPVEIARAIERAHGIGEQP